MKSTHQVLTEALALIENEDTWCRWAFFRNERGWTTTNIQTARSFCAIGAVFKVNGNAYKESKAEYYLRAAAKQMGYAGPAMANDVGGHAVVIAMYKRAIKNAKRRHINGD